MARNDSSSDMNTRREHDLLGTRDVPAGAYWGIHTLRAAENFPSTGARVQRALIAALANVKESCARTSSELGLLDEDKADAIIEAAREVASGMFADQFLTDALQGGAGTSTNMNVNEVIANRASELLTSTPHIALSPVPGGQVTHAAAIPAAAFDSFADTVDLRSAGTDAPGDASPGTGGRGWCEAASPNAERKRQKAEGDITLIREDAEEPRTPPAIIDPIADVNLHQSTNDAYPTALRIAAIRGIRKLADTIAQLQGALQRKEKEFANVVKIGRTELQDAVPMTLGMEFSAFAEAIGRDRWRTFKCEERLRIVNLGGTAIGTGITAPTPFILGVVERLRDVTGLGLARADNLVDATANNDSLVEVSGILKAHATTLLKLASDLRTLAMLGEIRLPALQAGSSIMPGKVNPVMLESATQIALKVIANDFLITEGVSRAHLQICELLPMVAHALLESLDLLNAIDGKLAAHIDGITASRARCLELASRSTALVTALVPEIGYEAATELVQEFARRRDDLPFLRFVEQRIGREAAARIVDPARVARLGHRDGDSRSLALHATTEEELSGEPCLAETALS